MRGTANTHYNQCEQEGNLGKANKNSMRLRCVLALLFLLVPNCGRRRKIGGGGGGGRHIGGLGVEEGRRGILSARTQLYLTYRTAGEYQRSERSLRGLGNTELQSCTKKLIHIHLLASFECEKLLLFFTSRNTLLRNSSSLMITYICTGFAEHPSHGHREDHRLFITAIVQFNCREKTQVLCV